jgi:hypothetical protein
MLTLDKLKPGTRIRLTQTIDRREGAWQSQVCGTVEAVTDAPTGSWYAHGKAGRYWLRRIKLRKDDGELSWITVDAGSRVEVLAPPDEGPAT